MALADSTRDAQWHLRFLDVATAHRYSQGSGVVVAVVDTGVDASHPDLAGNVLAGTETFVGSNGGNGWTDVDGHGTRMAGDIAAHGHGGGNGDGALGIAPKATILPVRAGTIGVTAIAPGIRWATDRGARVISVSAGNDADRGIQDSVEYAIAHDVVVVAAVGNAPEVSHIVYPAAYPGVVAVGGVDQGGDHASFSVTGPEVVLSAPGVAIKSTGPGRTYETGTGGTSDATAIVAGAAALVRSRFPNLSAVEVIHRLTATAIDKGSKGRDEQYGYGIVNLVGALTADVPPLSASPSPTGGSSAPTGSASPGNGISPWPGILVVLGILVVVGIVGLVAATRRRRTG